MPPHNDLDTLARDIVRQHSHLALQADALQRLPIFLAALPAVLTEPIPQAVYAACRALDFIDMDALCVANAWQHQSARTGQFDASAWPTEAEDFGVGADLDAPAAKAIAARAPLPQGTPLAPGNDQLLMGTPPAPGGDGYFLGTPPAPGGDGHFAGIPPAPGDDQLLVGAPPAPGGDGHFVGAPPAPRGDGHFAGTPPAPGGDGYFVGGPPSGRWLSGAWPDLASAFPPCPQHLGLYAVLPDAAWVGRMAHAGVPTVQLRFKSDDPAAITHEVQAAVQAVQGTGALLFINDHWQAAIAAGAYGVHLGQEDLAGLGGADLDAIRTAGLRLGLSSHGYAEMLRAAKVQPSYIAMGAVYATTLKRMATPPQGPARLKLYAALLRHMPTVAIGGIDAARLPEVLASGVGSVAVVRALVAADQPEAQVLALQAMFAH